MSDKAATIAILLSAGRGKRMNTDTAKQYLLLQGKPILYYSLKAFQESLIDRIVLVTASEDCDYVRREIVEKYGFTKVCCIAPGGKERYHSVYNGLRAAMQYGSDESYVFIHDGARPFVDREIIDRAYTCVKEEGACVVGMPVKDTIRITDETGYASDTPQRSLVWMMQTPQVFGLPQIYGAYKDLLEREQELLQRGIQITDDAGVLEVITGQRVKMVAGSYKNIKITTPEDLRIAQSFLSE